MHCEERGEQTLFQLVIGVRVNTESANDGISSASQTSVYNFDPEMDTNQTDKCSLHEDEVVDELEPVVEEPEPVVEEPEPVVEEPEPVVEEPEPVVEEPEPVVEIERFKPPDTSLPSQDTSPPVDPSCDYTMQCDPGLGPTATEEMREN